MKSKRKIETRGAKPSTGTVRAISLTRGGVSLKTLRLTFSSDVVHKLIELHERTWLAFHYDSPQERLRRLRFQFGKLNEVHFPGVFVRVEPPSYDMRGSRVTLVRPRNKSGKPSEGRYQCQILLRRLGLRDDLPSMKLETEWADNPDDKIHNGLYLLFPEQYVLPPTPTRRGEEITNLTV